MQAAHLWKDDQGKDDHEASEQTGNAEKPGKDARMLTLTLENLGAVGAEVPFTVRCEASDISQRLQVRAKSTATTRLDLPCTPLEIIVNDGSVPESDMTNNFYKIASQ